MDYEALIRPPADTPLTAALVGVGEFGASFLFRTTRVPGLRVLAAADADPSRVVAAARAAGFADDQIARCDTLQAVREAFGRRRFVAAPDAELLVDLPIDFIVEATGSPESAARTAQLAIGSGRNVAMISKECDSVIGPILQAQAAAAGLVCTSVDGDQPSLAIGLVSWARTLGLDVVCAGKASEYDFVFDPDRETVTAIGRTMPAPGMRARWNVDARELSACVAARAEQLTGWPHRTVPDLCELALIANATGLDPSTPGLHAPIARTLELPELLRPRSEGGLLERTGVLDIFNCLRRPDEISFAGGVFVAIRCDDPATWAVLRNKGIPTSADLRYALLHNPVHLLGIEAPISMMAALKFKHPSGVLTPRVDLIARATQPLARGTRLELGERHALAGVEPLLVPAQACEPEAPVPYYMAAGRQLRVDVAPGAVIRRKHLVEPDNSVLWALRKQQDALYFGSR